MKLFLTAVASLIVFITASANTKAAQPHCSLTDIAKFSAEFSNASSNKQLTQISAQVSQFLDACRADVFPTSVSPSNQIADFYDLVNKQLQAQLKTGQNHQCIKLGIATTEAWNSPYKMLKDAAVYPSIQKALVSCKTKREREITEKFSAEKCPLFGPNHKYSSAIAVPKKWKWQTRGATCVYLYGGKNRGKPEEEGIRLRENSPHLVVLQMEGDNLLEQYIDFSQGELATKDICLSGRIEGVDFLATGGRENKLLIRITSYAEHCLRDAASFYIDSVYELDPNSGLITQNELSTRLH